MEKILGLFRLAPVIILFFWASRHQKPLHMLIALLWMCALTSGVLLKWKYAGAVFGTPLVYLTVGTLIRKV